MVLRDITTKNSTPSSFLKGGYSLIELMVVVSIVVFISAIVLVNTKGSDRALAVKRQANEIALSLVKARDNAASSTPFMGNTVYGYGVHFNLQSDKQSYVIFADVNNNARCDDTACGCTAGCKQELVEKRILDAKTTLDNLGMNSVDALAYCSSTTCPSLTAYFCPPNPNTYIFGPDAVVTPPFNCSASNLNPNNITRGDIIVAGLGGGTTLQSKGIITVRKSSAIQVGYIIGATPVPPPLIPPPPPSENLNQIRYHWRNDVGGESAANSATNGTENTVLKNVLKNQTKRLRIEVANKGNVNSASTQYRIEYRIKGSSCSDDTVGTWRDVQIGPQWVMAVNSGGIVSSSATTDVNPISNGGVSNENQTFKAGYFIDSGSITPGMTLATSEFTELEYSISAGGSAPDGETYCFRVTNAGSTSKFTYQIYPELTLAGPSLAQVHYRWRADDGDEPAPPPPAGAGWATAEDTRLEGLIEENQRRLRIEVSNRGENNSAGVQYQLEYKTKTSSSCGGTGWGRVPVITDAGYAVSPWQIVDSTIAGVVDGEVTTNFSGSLSDDAGKTFVSGRLQDATNPTAAIALSKTQFTELEFSVKPTSFAQNGTTTCFRLTNFGSTASFDYISYPEAATIPAPEISVSDTSKYAWTPLAGWISFREESENRVVKVGITDFTGNAKTLSTDVFISFNCASAPKAGGDCGASDYKVTRNDVGTVFGWAWSDDYGWISMNCSSAGDCTYPYNVTINPTDGVFHGWAWNDILGWISFNCTENTDGFCVSTNYEVRLESALPQSANHPPNTICNVSPLTGNPGTATFVYNAIGTVDPEGNTPITYSWDLDGNEIFGDATGIGPINKIYPIEDFYTAQVRATDSQGNEKTTSCTRIAVSHPPVITSCILESTVPASGNFSTTDQIKYSVSANDPDNNQLYYTVNWGDASNSRVPSVGMVFDNISQNAYKIYSSPGNYTPNVIATDFFGINSPAYNCTPVTISVSTDTTAPSAVTNLAATSSTTSSVSLSWTAPGDDGNSGTATSFDIRYNTVAITSANFNSSSQATGEPIPGPAGTNHIFTVGGLNSATTYFFSIKTSDEVPNVSDVSNSPSRATASGPTLTIASFTANPASGTAPLSSNLSATIGGTATGTINYSFWWNCNNPSNSVATVEVDVTCGSGSLPAPAVGFCASNAKGYKCNAVSVTTQATSNNSYTPAGTYTGKVIVERGGVTPPEARATITVSAAATAPIVTSPTVTAITSSSATLGANVTSNGGAAITARGTCWGTTAAPLTNCTAEGGTTTGIFTHNRTGMVGSTSYFYRGYATNSVGTSYSADGTFTTLAGPTLTANLTANPSSGVAPLNSFLRATPGGTATGTMNYSFVWNCNDASDVYSTIVTNCLGGVALTTPSAGTCVADATGRGYKCDGVSTNPQDTPLHSYSAVQSYTGKVVIERQSLSKGASASITVTAAPTVPNVPTGVSATRGNTQITLNWSTPFDGGSPITSYVIYRSLTSGTETLLLDTLSTSTTYINIGLTNGQIYFYKITAKNAVGESVQSAEVSATPATTPGVPTGLTATAGNAQVTLNWTAPASNGGSAITNYAVYRSTTSGTEVFLQNTGSTSPSFINTGLTNGQIYFYKVATINSVGTGGQSNEASATPVAPPTLTASVTANPSSGVAPLNSFLRATPGGTATGTINYNFYWNCSSAADTYAQAQIDCGGALTTPAAGSCIADVGGKGYKCDGVSTNPQDTALHSYTSAGTYTGKVVIERQSIAKGATAAISVTAAVTTTIANGINPGSVTIGPGVVIPTDLDTFTLQASTGTDTVTALTVTLGPAGAFNNIAQVDIADNISSLVRCTAVTNPASNTISFTTCSSNGGISVTTGVSTYKVRITPKSHAAMPAVPGASYATTGTVTAFTSTNTQAGTDSGSATVTVDNASPANVTAASGSAGNAQVTLNWTNPADADLSQIIVLRRATTAVGDTPVEGTTYIVGNVIGSSTVGCVVSSPTATCIDSGLTNGTAYHYKIFAKDSLGNYSSLGTIPTGSPFTPSAAGGFPIVVATATSQQTGNSATPVVSLPAGVAVGDLIIAILAEDGIATATWPSPWVELVDVNAAIAANFHIAYLIASGGETTVTPTLTLSERSQHITLRISAASWHGVTPPAVATNVTGFTNAPNSGSLTPSWGSLNTLWITAFGQDAPDTAFPVTAWPANYTGSNISMGTGAVSTAGVAVATRNLAAASDDPGAFGTTFIDDWAASTIAIRPK